MQLKTFTANNSAIILAQIREELGPEAIIIDTSEKDGIISMTAALDPAGAAFAPAGKVMPHPVPNGPGNEWQQEWGSIKSHLLTLMKPTLRLDLLSPQQRMALEFLQQNGLEDEVAFILIKKLQEDTTVSIFKPLGDLVKVRPWNTKQWPQQTHVIAGPFGAGKTSVTIRMALALRKQQSDMRICLINADATRGNGRLLLRHYSELSDLAYKEAASTIELIEALYNAEKEGFTRIFVDLPGLSRGRYLSTLLEDAGMTNRDIAVHLTLPLHYSSGYTEAMLQRYKSNQAGSIIWTKLDEAEQFSAIVNIAHKSHLPVSALSYGPSLGGSFSSVKPVMLWRMLFKGELPSTP